MIFKWRITIPELTGKETRAAYVYVPESFKEDPEARYPVLYMFDGHNVFFDEDATYGKSWGMAEFVEETELPIMIVAVECNHHPNGGRLSEYSPFTFRDRNYGHIKGRGKTTMHWLTHTFKPYIDKNFPTLPDRKYTFIAGSSMGGLMSLYAVTAYNHVFSRAACLSPSIWVAPEQIDMLLSRTKFRPDTVIYMDYGSNELSNHGGMKRRLAKVASKLIERDVAVTCRIVPWGDHSEASWQEQIPVFLETMLYGLD